MSYLKRNSTYLLATSILLLFGILPNLKFVLEYLEWVNLLGDETITTNLFLWDYMFYYTDSAFVIHLFAPILIVLYSLFSYFTEIRTGYVLQEMQRKEYCKVMSLKVLKVWMKSLVPLLSYSLLLFLIAFSLPTATNVAGVNNKEMMKYFLFIHANMIFFSLFIANIGIIVVFHTRRFILSLVLTQIIFLTITIIIYFIGLLIDIVFGTPNYSELLYIYNLIVLDSGVSYVGSLVYAFCLFAISSLLVYIKLRDKERVVNIIER